jgi:isoleucyl-tRNA synthetase
VRLPGLRPGTAGPELERRWSHRAAGGPWAAPCAALHNLKIRQPLKALHLVTRNPEKRILIEMEEIIREELNVKAVVFRENEEELVELSARPNYRLLGKALGKDMKAAAERIQAPVRPGDPVPARRGDPLPRPRTAGPFDLTS